MMDKTCIKTAEGIKNPGTNGYGYKPNSLGKSDISPPYNWGK
jgi:hypothetical protein